MEYFLLECLVLAEGVAVTRQDLYRWMHDNPTAFLPNTNIIDVYVSRMRKRILNIAPFIKNAIDFEGTTGYALDLEALEVFERQTK